MPQAYRLSGATGIHRGDREYQQDQVTLMAHPRNSGCVLAVLADGMGGRSGGRNAADQVMLTARQLFERYGPPADDGSAMLSQLVDQSHTVIKLMALSSEQEPHSTVAAFLVNPEGDCHWVHAGDSRIYHYRNGRMVKQTKDHSLVQALVDRGEIPPAEAETHPQSHVLIGCLGTHEAPPKEAHYIPRLESGDVLMACSDGIWHHFSNDEMGRILYELPPRDASQFMVDKARSRAAGQGDNLSVVIVKIAEAPVEPALAN